MSYKGCFIARIPNDEKAQSTIDKLKTEHGQLRLHGRHKDRKGAMKAVGRTLNTHGDLPWWLGTEIMIYRGESGTTYPKQTGVGIVVDKKGKNKLKVAMNGSTEWTTRNKVILFT
jgi:hypothetical protein